MDRKESGWKDLFCDLMYNLFGNCFIDLKRGYIMVIGYICKVCFFIYVFIYVLVIYCRIIDYFKI